MKIVGDIPQRLGIAQKTPRIEEGTKVVLPSGEVRLITATEFDFDGGVVTGVKLIFSDRWSPRVS